MPNISPDRSRPVVEINVEDHFFAFLINPNMGAGLDASNMGVDGSGAPITFSCIVPDLTGRTLVISTMVIIALNADLSQPTNFLGISSLTNGVIGTYKKALDDVEMPIWTHPIKSDFEFLHHTVSGARDESIIPGGASLDFSTITFDHSFIGFRLIFNKGDSINLTVQDDLTGIDEFRIALHGYWRGI